MARLTAKARIALADADEIIRPLCDHLAEHGAKVRHEPDATFIDYHSSTGILSAGDRHLVARVEAPDMAALQAMRQAIASHVIEFARGDPPPRIVWEGDGAALSTPPDFRVLTVTDAIDLTPHMRRIVFRGTDLARFDRLDALHVRLFFPPAGVVRPAWPMLGEDGLVRQPPADQRLAVRKYTIREIDVAAGTLSIDFVLHGDAGPGTAFASRAKAGDQIGMAGPGGRGLREAEFYLFVADATGLPAVARMLSALPDVARGIALLEVDEGEEQEFRVPNGFDIRRLRPDGAPGNALLVAIRALSWPPCDSRLYLWAATEFATFKAIRAFAKERLRQGADEHLVVSYWRDGRAGNDHE